MDIRSLTPAQIHDIDRAAAGRFLAILHEAMIIGPFTDADVAVDFAGQGYRFDLVFGCGKDGCMGKMARLVVEDGHALPETVRLGLMVLQISCLQHAMAERRRRSEARAARIMAERAARTRT